MSEAAKKKEEEEKLAKEKREKEEKDKKDKEEQEKLEKEKEEERKRIEFNLNQERLKAALLAGNPTELDFKNFLLECDSQVSARLVSIVSCSLHHWHSVTATLSAKRRPSCVTSQRMTLTFPRAQRLQSFFALRALRCSL